MKNKLSILLRAGVFTLAAVFAFAFTQPKPQQGPFVYDPLTDTFTDVSGVNYQCNMAFEEICVYLEPNLESETIPGRFEEL
ncbi:hypothetical protein [Belliella pelovolcani]|jgi:hypothetical protein|uniref:Uncharacterized protein n=1 Tax=Belliella pelovolcani TaxID=529505 RepID=A0A1N7KE55_9BACT|nr:hypothetical protein [Belliella pelovolcani]SIS59845.1 hypothetical protein SAMN05421761_1029 [Belliella pelovolcani]